MPNRVRNLLLALAILTSACASDNAPRQETSELAEFCRKLPRPAYAQFEKHLASNDWFEVYEVAADTYAIYEPFQWQEVISYLIVGADRALLFDTGNGIADIRAVVDQLTARPVTVLNSHSHIDHIGGNYQFDDIRVMDTAFTRLRSRGVDDDSVRLEASPVALCKPLPNGLTAEDHVIRAFSPTGTIADGDQLDLGGRMLEVIAIPGHTEDPMALLERATGFLWMGDSYYAGPIWLFADETDMQRYRASLERLVALAPGLTALFPAHNTPREPPSQLTEVLQAFDQVMAGEMAAEPAWDDAVSFDFGSFGFLVRRDLLPKAEMQE